MWGVQHCHPRDDPVKKRGVATGLHLTAGVWQLPRHGGLHEHGGQVGQVRGGGNKHPGELGGS